MRVYIAGPMAGYPDGNRPAFNEAANRVHRAGHTPVNPADVTEPDHTEPCCPGPTPDHYVSNGHSYGCYLREGIRLLLTSEAIMFLDNWDKSVGASTEAHVARSIGLPVVEF